MIHKAVITSNNMEHITTLCLLLSINKQQSDNTNRIIHLILWLRTKCSRT